MSTLRRTAVLAAALCAVAAQAGLKMTSELKRKGKTSTFSMQLEGKSVRMEVAKDGSAEPSGAYVVDSDAKRALIINYDKKEYTEITQEQMKQMRAKMDAAMSMMKERMAQLPPEQRKQMEAMMAQRQGTAAKAPMADEKYTRVGGSKTVAGYKCELYSVEKDGQHVADTCFIPWSELKGLDREQFKQTVQGMSEAWDFGGASRENPMVRAWGLDLGLPGWRKSLKDDPEGVTETTLTSLAQGAVPKSAFEAPAGFTKKSMDRH
jgi:hypothetical protein